MTGAGRAPTAPPVARNFAGAGEDSVAAAVVFSGPGTWEGTGRGYGLIGGRVRVRPHGPHPRFETDCPSTPLPSGLKVSEPRSSIRVEVDSVHSFDFGSSLGGLQSVTTHVKSDTRPLGLEVRSSESIPVVKVEGESGPTES